MYPHQADRLTAAADRHGLDALVAVASDNVRYVTGFASAVESVYRDPGHRAFGVFTRRGFPAQLARALSHADQPHVTALRRQLIHDEARPVIDHFQASRVMVKI